jgi:hypothetical protein
MQYYKILFESPNFFLSNTAIRQKNKMSGLLSEYFHKSKRHPLILQKCKNFFRFSEKISRINFFLIY